MTHDLHPFISSFGSTGVFNVLPPQLISKKKKYAKKDKYNVSSWQKQCMDSLETIARVQYNENKKLVENYKLINGEFIPQDYIECEDCDQYLDPLKELVKDGQIPKFIKHYDIISTPVNKMINEMDDLPSTISVVGKGDPIQSEKEEQQTRLLQKYMYSSIDQKLNSYLQEQGVDPNQKLDSPEEQSQFDQQIQQQKEEMTPKEIKEYMEYNYRHIAELWGEYELEDQKERYKLKKLVRDEFKDVLVSARRFRHLRIANDMLTPETWNPLNVFFQKSPDIEYVQDGDYAGRIFIGSIPYVIDRYGKFMTSDQIESLETSFQNSNDPFRKQEDWLGNKVNYLSALGVPYNTVLASKNPSLNQVAREFNQTPVAGNLLNDIYGNSGYTTDFQSSNMCVITEAYWKSQMKIGRLCWINPETNLKEIILVDESFIVPDYIETKKILFAEVEPEIDTISWTWINEIWKGIKINAHNSNSTSSALYLDIKPTEYQYKSSAFLNTVQIPVCGQIFNSKNASSKSFIDLQKPLQFVHNILMNKAVKMLEVSILPFLALNINMMPNQKDWGGDESQSKLEKILQAGQNFGAIPTDSSPSNVQAGTNSKFAEVIDIDLTSRIIQMFNAASSIRMLALQQVGFTPERMGDVKGIDTATGINTSVSSSYSSTSHWFTEFMECEKDIIKMQLDIAQWLQSKGKDISASYTKSDFSQAWLRFNNENFNLYDLHVYISNSQKELKILEDYKRLAIEMNTVELPMSSRMEMLDMVSPERIKKIIKKAEQEANQRSGEINRLKEKELTFKDENEKKKNDDELTLAYAKLENDLKKAYISAFGHSQKAGEDMDSSGIPDMLEYEKFEMQAENAYSKMNLDKEKFELEKQKEKREIQNKDREFLLKRKDQELKEKAITQTATNVKVMDKGKYKS
jgi:hypothetical protein